MAVAFFDLDLTLLEMNTASLWIKRELRLGHISRGFFLKSVMQVGMYQLGITKMEEVLEKAMLLVRGIEEARMEERTRIFWNEEVKHRFRPGALMAIEHHRAEGDECVLLTSSSPYLCRAVCSELGLEGFLCTELEVAEGRFTGRPAGRLCYGEGKREKAEAFAAERGVSLADCAFYTDSYSDLPALLAVGRPVAVHPDPRLRRYAAREGWEIVDWGRAGT